MKSDIKQIFGNLAELKRTLYGDTSVEPSVLPLDADAVMYYAKPKSNSNEIVRSKNFLIVFSPCEKFEDNIEPDKSPFVDALETYNVDSIDETNISFSQSFSRFLSGEQLKDNALGQIQKWNFNEIDTDVLFIRDKETRWYTNTIKTLVEEQEQPTQNYTERMLEEFVTDVIFDELQNYPEIHGEKRQVALYGGHEGAGYGALRALVKIGEILKNDQSLGVDDNSKINYARIFNFTVYAYNFQTDILYEEFIKNAPIDEFVIRELYPDLYNLPAEGYKILRTEYENVSEEIRNLYDLSEQLDLYLSDTSLPLKLVVGGGHPIEGIENEAQSKIVTLSEAEEWSNHLLYFKHQYTNGLADIVDSETGTISWRFNVIYTENLKNNIIQELSLRLMNQVPAEQGTLGGRVVDGYIANANGKLLSFTGNKLDDGTLETNEVTTFTTDDAGRWSITLGIEEIPTTYKIEFVGGTDILTGEEYKGTLTSIGTLDIGPDATILSNENVNISPISTIKSKLLENVSGVKLSTKGWVTEDNDNINRIIENAFGLTEDEVNSDYIHAQNPKALKANLKLNLVKNVVTSLFNDEVDESNKITHDDFISGYAKTLFTESFSSLQEDGNITNSVTDGLGTVIETIADKTSVSEDVIDSVISSSQSVALTAMSGMDDVSNFSSKQASSDEFISNNFLISAKKLGEVNNRVTKLLGVQVYKSAESDTHILDQLSLDLESIKNTDFTIDNSAIVSVYGHAEKIIKITLDNRDQNPWDPVFHIDDPLDDSNFLYYEYVFLTKHKDASFENYDNNVWVGETDQDLNLEYGSPFDDLPMANGTPIISKTRNKIIKLPRIIRENKEHPAEIYAEDDYKLKCVPYVRRVTKDRYSKFVKFVPTDVYSKLYYSPITRYQGDDSEGTQTSNFKQFNFNLTGMFIYPGIEVNKVANDVEINWSHKVYELSNLHLKIQKWKFDFYLQTDDGTTYEEIPRHTELVESANIKQELNSYDQSILEYSYKINWMHRDLIVGYYKLVISATDSYSENHKINADDLTTAKYDFMAESTLRLSAKSQIDKIWENNINQKNPLGTAKLNPKLRFSENDPTKQVFGSLEIQTPLHDEFHSIEYSIRTINTGNSKEKVGDAQGWDVMNYQSFYETMQLDIDVEKVIISRTELLNYFSEQGINAADEIGVHTYEFEIPAITNEIYLLNNDTAKQNEIYYYILDSYLKLGENGAIESELEEGDNGDGIIAYDFRTLPDLVVDNVKYNNESDKYEIQLSESSFMFVVGNQSSYANPHDISKAPFVRWSDPLYGILGTSRTNEFSISVNNEEYKSITPSLDGVFTIDTIPSLSPMYIKLRYSSSNPYISDETLVLNIDVDVSEIKFHKVKNTAKEDANYYSAFNYSEVGNTETDLYLEWDDVKLTYKRLPKNKEINNFSAFNPILKYRIQFNDDDPFIVSSNKLNISEYLKDKSNIVGEYEIKVSATDENESQSREFTYNLNIQSDDNHNTSVVFGKGLGLEPLASETGGDFEFQWHFKEGNYVVNNSNRLKHYELFLDGEILTRTIRRADPEDLKLGSFNYQDVELDYFEKNSVNTYTLQVDESGHHTFKVVGVLEAGIKTAEVSHMVNVKLELPAQPSGLDLQDIEEYTASDNGDVDTLSNGKIPFEKIPSISWTEDTDEETPVTHYRISLGSFTLESEKDNFNTDTTGTLSYDFATASEAPILEADNTYTISIIAINQLNVESDPAMLNFDVYYTSEQLLEIETATRNLLTDDGLNEELVVIRDGYFPPSIQIPTTHKYPSVTDSSSAPQDVTMLVTMDNPVSEYQVPTKSYVENDSNFKSHGRYYRLLTFNGSIGNPKWGVSKKPESFKNSSWQRTTKVSPNTKLLVGKTSSKFVVKLQPLDATRIKKYAKNPSSYKSGKYLFEIEKHDYRKSSGNLEYIEGEQSLNIGSNSGFGQEVLKYDFESPNKLDDFNVCISADIVSTHTYKQEFDIVVGESCADGSFRKIHEKVFGKDDDYTNGTAEYVDEPKTIMQTRTWTVFGKTNSHTSEVTNPNFSIGMPRTFPYSEVITRYNNERPNSKGSPVFAGYKFRSAVKYAISKNYKDFICVATQGGRPVVITLIDERAPKGKFAIYNKTEENKWPKHKTIPYDSSLIGGEKLGVVVNFSGNAEKVILGARSFIRSANSQSMNDIYTTNPSFAKNSDTPQNRRIDSTFSSINENGYAEKKEWVLYSNDVVKYYKIYAKTQITDEWYLIKEGSFEEIIQSTELKRFPSFRDKSYSSKWEFDFAEVGKIKIINKRKPNKFTYQEMIMVKEYTDYSLNHRKIIKFCSGQFPNLTLSDEQIKYRKDLGYSPIAKVYDKTSDIYKNITWGSFTTTDSSYDANAVFEPHTTHPSKEKTPPKICARKIVSNYTGDTVAVSIHTDEIIERYNREDIAYLKVFVNTGDGYIQKGQGISYLDCNEHGDFDISGDGNILVVSANKLTTKDCVKVFNYDAESDMWILNPQNEISMESADRTIYSPISEFTDLDGIKRKSYLFGSEVSISTNGNTITINAPGARRLWINSRCNISGGVFIYEYNSSISRYKKIPTPFSSFLNAFEDIITENFDRYVKDMKQRMRKLGYSSDKYTKDSIFNIIEAYLGLNLGGVIEWQDSNTSTRDTGPNVPTKVWYYDDIDLAAVETYGFAPGIPVKPNNFIKTKAPLEVVSIKDRDNSQILPKNQFYRVVSNFDTTDDSFVSYSINEETYEVDYADLSHLFILIKVVVEGSTEKEFLVKRTDRVDKWELVLPEAEITNYDDNVPPFEPVFKSNLINYTANKTPTWQWNPVNKKVNNTDIVQTLLEEGAEYNYYLNDNSDTASVTTTTDLEFTPTDYLDVGKHTLYLSAKDVVGNESGQVTYDIQVVGVNNLIVDGIKYFGTDSPEEITAYGETWYVSPSNLLDITWNKLADNIANDYKTIYYRVVLYKPEEVYLDEELVFESQLFTDNNFTMHYKVPMGYYKIGVGVVAIDENDNTLNSDYVYFMVKTNEQAIPHNRSCLPFNLKVLDTSDTEISNQVSIRKHNGSIIANHPTDATNPHPWYFHKPIYYATVSNAKDKQVKSFKVTLAIADEWLPSNQTTESDSIVSVSLFKVVHGDNTSGVEEDKYHGSFLGKISVGNNITDDGLNDGFTTGDNASEYITDGIMYFNGRERTDGLNYVSTTDYDSEKNYKYSLTNKIRFVDVEIPNCNLDAGIYEIHVKVANSSGETYDYPIGDLSNTYFYDQSTKQQVSNYNELYNEAFNNKLVVDYDVTRLVLKNTSNTANDIQITVNDDVVADGDSVNLFMGSDIKIDWTDLEPSIDSRSDSLLYPFSYKVRFEEDELEIGLSTPSITKKYQGSLGVNSYYTTSLNTQTNYAQDLLNYEYVLPSNFIREVINASVTTIEVYIDIYHFGGKLGTRTFTINLDSNTVELVEHTDNSSDYQIEIKDNKVELKWAYSLDMTDHSIFKKYKLRLSRSLSSNTQSVEVVHEEEHILEELQHYNSDDAPPETHYYDVFEYIDTYASNTSFVAHNYTLEIDVYTESPTASFTYELASSYPKESVRGILPTQLTYDSDNQTLSWSIDSLSDRNKTNRNLVELFDVSGEGEDITTEKLGEKTFEYDATTDNIREIDLKDHFSLKLGLINIQVTSYLLDNGIHNYSRTSPVITIDCDVETQGFEINNLKQKYTSKINLSATEAFYNTQTYANESFYENGWKLFVSYWKGLYRQENYVKINTNEKPNWTCVDPYQLDTTETDAEFSFTWNALAAAQSYTIKLRTYKITHEFANVLDGNLGKWDNLYWGKHQPTEQDKWMKEHPGYTDECWEDYWCSTGLEVDTSLKKANFSQLSKYEKKFIGIKEYTIDGDETEFKIPSDYINSYIVTDQNTRLFQGNYEITPRNIATHKENLSSKYHWGYITELEIVATRSDGYITQPVYSESLMFGDVKTKINLKDEIYANDKDLMKVNIDFIMHPFYNKTPLQITNRYKIVPIGRDADNFAWITRLSNNFGKQRITRKFANQGVYTLFVESTDNFGNTTEAQSRIVVGSGNKYFNQLSSHDEDDYTEPKTIPKYTGLLSAKYNEYAFAFVSKDEISKRINAYITHHPGLFELELYNKTNTDNSYEYKIGDFIRFNDDYTFELPEHVGSHEQVTTGSGVWVNEDDPMIASPIYYSERTNGVLDNMIDHKNLFNGYKSAINTPHTTRNNQIKNAIGARQKSSGMGDISKYLKSTLVNSGDFTEVIKQKFYIEHEFQTNSKQDVSSHDTSKKYGVIYGVNKTDTETELYVFLNGGCETTLWPPERGHGFKKPNPPSGTGYVVDEYLNQRDSAYTEYKWGPMAGTGGRIKIKISDSGTGANSGLWDVVAPITTEESLEASGLYKDEYATYTDNWIPTDLIRLNENTTLNEIYINDDNQVVELNNNITMQANDIIGLKFKIQGKFVFRVYSTESKGFKLYRLPDDVDATRWVSDPDRIVIQPGYPKHPQIIVDNIDNFTSSSNVYPTWKYSFDKSPGIFSADDPGYDINFQEDTYYERHLLKKNDSGGWDDVTSTLNVESEVSGVTDSDDVLLFKSGNDATDKQIALQNGTYKFTIQTIFKNKDNDSDNRKSTIAESRELTINLDPPANIYSLELTEQGGYEYTPGDNVEIYSNSGEYVSQIEADKVKWKWNLFGFTSEDGHYEVTLKEYIVDLNTTDQNGNPTGEGEFVEILKEEVNSTQFAFDDVKLDSIYKIEVVAVNLQGVSSDEPADDTIRMTDLTPPNSVTNIKFETPTFPVSFGVEQFFNDIPTWSWGAVDDAYEYRIDLEYADAKYDVSELHIGHTNNSLWVKQEDGTYKDPDGSTVDFTDTTYTDADGKEWPEPYNIPTIETGSGWSPPSEDEELLDLRNVKTNSFTPPKSLSRGKFWRIKVTAIDSYGNESNVTNSSGSYHLPHDTDKDEVADFYDYWKSDPTKKYNVSYLESLIPNPGLAPRVGNLVRFIGTAKYILVTQSYEYSVWDDGYNNPEFSVPSPEKPSDALKVQITPESGGWDTFGRMPTYAIVTWVHPTKSHIINLQYGPYTLRGNVETQGAKVDSGGNIISGKFVFVTRTLEEIIPQTPTNLSHNEEKNITTNKKPKFSWTSLDVDTFILKVDDEVVDDPTITKSENNFEYTPSEDLLGIIKFSVIATSETGQESEEVSITLRILKDTDNDSVADDFEYFIYDADDQRTTGELDEYKENSNRIPVIGDIIKLKDKIASPSVDGSKPNKIIREYSKFPYYKIIDIINNNKFVWYDGDDDVNRYFGKGQRTNKKWEIVSTQDQVNETNEIQQIQAMAEEDDNIEPISEEEKVAVVEYEDDPTGTPEVGSIIQFKKPRTRKSVPPGDNYQFKVGDYAKINKELKATVWLITRGSVENEDDPYKYTIPKSWIDNAIISMQKIKE